MVKEQVPKQLQLLFIMHFIIDLFVAIPLFLFPSLFLTSIGFEISSAGIALSRVVAAALIGIGTTSLLSHHKQKESYQTMLTLKLLWSASATVGLLIGAIQTKVTVLYLFTAIFAAFFLIWLYWKKQLEK